MLALVYAHASEGVGGIIPADRTINWTPGVNVGIPGGIPNRPIGKNAVTDYGADPSGVNDSKTAIQNAINNTASGTAAYLPPGTYKIAGTLAYRSGVSLRGAGMGQTILDCRTDGALGNFTNSGDWPNPAPTINIMSGATKGSTSVSVDTTTGAAVGKLITISALNPPYVFSDPALYGSGPTNVGHDGTRLLASTHYVISISGSTINFSPPLPIDMSDTPMITLWTSIVANFGMEDLTFDQKNTTATGAIYLSGGYKCWFKNVEVKNTTRRQMWFMRLVNCEIRGCYTHDTIGTGPNHEGIDLVQNCCFNLIEDNICYRGGKPAIMLGDWGGGCNGNVIAYNYMAANPTGSGGLETSISANHGPHNVMNLIEGNVGQAIKSDGYYGSTSHLTVFRNIFTGDYPSTYDWPLVVQMCKWTYFTNFVGNVLGKDGAGQVYTITTNGYGQKTNVIWQLGFPNTGNSSYSNTYTGTPLTPGNPPPTGTPKFDQAVVNSMIRHGNYDFANNSTEWDPSISDRTIPASLCRSAKPAWWPSTVSWPPIGPDKTPMVSKIPAQIRFQTLAAIPPKAPKNLRKAP